MEKMRLQKYLAESGVASRRKAEELIAGGHVTVNGSVVTAMGTKVSDSDEVAVDGKVVRRSNRKVYIMLNKPVGVITSAKDQFSRKTVLDLVPAGLGRLFPVGRLDYDTSGLLLLTNDGAFAYMMTHPSHEVEKVYVAEIKGIVSKEEIASFESGLMIDGRITSQARLRVLKTGKDSSTVEITLHEGRNRQVRKMCEAISHPVLKLKRIAIGPLSMGNLREGEWRHLSKKELSELNKHVQRQAKKKNPEI